MTHAVQTQLMLERRHLPSGRPSVLHALLRVQADSRPDLKRPPLDLVACIDVSGSMHGRKLEEVKRSLVALAGELSSQDRLGVTSFESAVTQVLPPTKMDAAGKQRLQAAVAGLQTLGSTNMSGGLLGAIGDLNAAPAPATDAVRRVLLFTDGHANVGVPENDRSSWAALVRDCLQGVSVSWFGFGEDHDADFLSFLADLTRGNAYVARDEDAITDAFAQELGGLLGVRAMDLELTLTVQHGTARLLNDERSEARGERLVIHVDDLACEERKDLVVELQLPTPGSDVVEVVLEARCRDVITGEVQHALLVAALLVTDAKPEAPNPEVLEALALVCAANAQKQARAFAEQGRWADAVRTLEEAARRLLALDSERAQALAKHLERFVEDYATEQRYRSNRSKLKSAERAMSKQRSTGSAVDEFFATERKRELQLRFKGPPRGAGKR